MGKSGSGNYLSSFPYATEISEFVCEFAMLDLTYGRIVGETDAVERMFNKINTIARAWQIMTILSQVMITGISH